MKAYPNGEPFWKRHLDKIGVGGSVFTALCCLGFPAVLAILSAAGLGFLINDAILVPLLVLFLLASLWGLYLGRNHHGSPAPLYVGFAGSAMTVVSIGFGSGWLAGIGISGMVAASALNVWLKMRQLRPR